MVSPFASLKKLSCAARQFPSTTDSRCGGTCGNEVERLHDELKWNISSDLSMPSLPPCDAAAPVHGTHVHAIGTSITITDISRPRHRRHRQPMISSSPWSFCPTTSLWPIWMILLSCSHPPSPTRGSKTSPPTTKRCLLVKVMFMLQSFDLISSSLQFLVYTHPLEGL